MLCPVDKEKLVCRIYEDDIEVDQCPRCQGIWLDRGEIGRIEQSRENDYGAIIQRTASEKMDGFIRMINHTPLETVSNTMEERQLKCPSCGDVLYQKEHGYFSKIMIDSCVSCQGVWLDKGELQAIEIFFEQNKPVESLNFWQHFKLGLKNIF